VPRLRPKKHLSDLFFPVEYLGDGQRGLDGPKLIPGDFYIQCWGSYWDLLRSYQSGGALRQSMCTSRGKHAKLIYMEIKQPLDRKVIKNKRGTLTNRDIKLLVQEIQDHWREGKLQQSTVEMEIRAIQRKIQRYDVEQLGEIPMEREDRTMRILICQMGGCASVETREIKIAATERLICKYDINLCLFVELNFNWSKVNLSSNLASWFTDKDKMHHSTQRRGKQQTIQETPTSRDRNVLPTWISTIHLAASSRPKWPLEMVLLAILL
jgi:hypothetical protein